MCNRLEAEVREDGSGEERVMEKRKMVDLGGVAAWRGKAYHHET